MSHNTSRYLVGAILSAMILGKYLEALIPFLEINLSADLHIPAFFLTVTGIYLVYSILDAGLPDESLANESFFVEITTIILYMLMLGILFQIVQQFLSLKGEMPSIIFMKFMATYFGLRVFYQFFTMAGTKNLMQQQKLLQIAGLCFKKKDEIIITDHKTKRIFFLFGELIIFAVYLLTLFIRPPDSSTLLIHCCLLIFYSFIWRVHYYSKT